MKIAFIGLGNMGTGIAQCILKSGHDLIVWNRTATKTGPLVALGEPLDVSDARMANVMKLAINYNVISTIELISQSYIFAEKCGLPLEYLRDFYQQLWFAHPAPKMYAEKLLKRDFAGRGGFVMTGGLKDVRLMLSTAAEAGTKLEFGEIAERNLSNAVDTGMGERDWSAIHELARKKAGLA